MTYHVMVNGKPFCANHEVMFVMGTCGHFTYGKAAETAVRVHAALPKATIDIVKGPCPLMVAEEEWDKRQAELDETCCDGVTLCDGCHWEAECNSAQNREWLYMYVQSELD